MCRRIIRGQATRDCELEDLPHPLFRTPADIERASCFDLADHCQDVGCRDFIHEFLADMSKDRPWMLKPSSGSGAQGNNGKNAASGKTMRRADYDALSPVQQREFAVTAKGQVVD